MGKARSKAPAAASAEEWARAASTKASNCPVCRDADVAFVLTECLEAMEAAKAHSVSLAQLCERLAALTPWRSSQDALRRHLRSHQRAL